MKLLFVFLALVPLSEACFSLGGCGGGCMPPIPPVCRGGCGGGYGCGSYGCYKLKAKARSAKTLSLLSESHKTASSPDERFMECCQERKLPDSCLNKCSYRFYTRTSLQAMYFKQDSCPLQAAADIQFCAAQGRDHRACCERNGVSTTLAGSKCLAFCDMRPGNVTHLDFTYLSCYDRFDNMKACFYQDSARENLPPKQFVFSEDDRMKPNSKWFILSSLLFLFLAYALHKPFPPGFCKSPLDRAILYVIEPFLRVTYYWPSLAFFTKATDRVWWTRSIFVVLSPIMSLKWDSHGTIKTETVQWAGVTTRVYSPKENATTDGAVVFIHGGGFAIGDIYLYDSLTKRMAAMLNSVVISIDYRLSPETVYPGQLTDCEGVLAHFIEVAKDKYGVDPNKIVIMGDSAGGNLAAVITQRRKLRGAVPQLLGQVLLYPLLQLADLQSTSYRYYHKHLDGFAFVDPASVALYYMFYAGIDMNKHGHLIDHILTNSHVKNEHRDKIDKFLRFEEFSHLNYSGADIPPKQVAGPHSELQEIMAPWVVNPEFSPIMREDLSGLPKALVVTCEYDVLRDEGMMYAKRLEEAGVPTTHKNYVNGFHAMLNFHWEIDEAYKATEEIVEWVRQVLLSA